MLDFLLNLHHAFVIIVIGKVIGVNATLQSLIRLQNLLLHLQQLVNSQH